MVHKYYFGFREAMNGHGQVIHDMFNHNIEYILRLCWKYPLNLQRANIAAELVKEDIACMHTS